MFKEEILNATEIFTNYGCTEVKPYSLVNNHGYTFKYNEVSYDIRFWRNCYGVELNYWDVSVDGNSDATKVDENKTDIEEIKKLFNEKCR